MGEQQGAVLGHGPRRLPADESRLDAVPAQLQLTMPPYLLLVRLVPTLGRQGNASHLNAFLVNNDYVTAP